MSEEEFLSIVRIKPWVNDSFIGPSIQDLLVGYYVAQGEKWDMANEFTKAHLKALYEKI